jgi:phospholipase/carboxylesterase
VDRQVTRRQFALRASRALALVAFGGGSAPAAAQSNDGRLMVRPRDKVVTSLKTGPLGLGKGIRDGVIQMPSTMPDGKVPLLVYFHGATGNGAGVLGRIGPAADQSGVAVLAPDSRDGTWDVIRGSFGEDVAFLNRALELVFERLDVDPARLAIGGFSDGASYALSLGLANGDLFPRVVAGSPGFVVSATPHGRPRFFISHGISDQILPIDQCSRRIVPRLKSMGYDVTFREFEGRHELPPAIANEALRWMTATDPA